MDLLLQQLPKLEKEGLAVDIDETLSWTVGYWMETMLNKFGNPENLSVNEMIRKYRYTQNIPYWQTREALDWMEEKRNSNDFQKELPVIKDADVILKEINEIVPVAAYLTIRPNVVDCGTTEWLKKHNFPLAPIISRPSELPSEKGNEWKGAALGKLYPAIKGIIDDNAGILPHINPDYKGHVFLYDNSKVDCNLNVIPCLNWGDVLREIKKVFK